MPTDDAAGARTPGIIDLSLPKGPERRCLRGLVSLAGAVGLVLLVPFVIVLVGLPITLAVRGLLELVQWVSSNPS